MTFSQKNNVEKNGMAMCLRVHVCACVCVYINLYISKSKTCLTKVSICQNLSEKGSSKPMARTKPNHFIPFNLNIPVAFYTQHKQLPKIT